MSAKTRQAPSHRHRGAHAPSPRPAADPRSARVETPKPAPRTHPAVEPRAGARPAKAAPARRYRLIERQRRRALLLKVGGALVLGVAVLALVYLTGGGAGSAVTPGRAGQYRFDVANPAAGAMAPDFTLPATTGGTLRLNDFRGQTVLLYFQEGLGCEGCWTQMKDIQAAMGAFKALGIDALLTVTTNPLGALKQKVADEGIATPVLSDESFAASRAYDATRYGMMAGSADGHTFILVGPDGRIRWRADYGGPPAYTMYVPVSNLLADIKVGLGKAGADGK